MTTEKTFYWPVIRWQHNRVPWCWPRPRPRRRSPSHSGSPCWTSAEHVVTARGKCALCPPARLSLPEVRACLPCHTPALPPAPISTFRYSFLILFYTFYFSPQRPQRGRSWEAARRRSGGGKGRRYGLRACWGRADSFTHGPEAGPRNILFINPKRRFWAGPVHHLC